MKKISRFAIVAALAAVATLLASARPQHANRAVNPPGSVSGLPFSNGIVAGNALYVAGQQGLEGGKLRPGGIAPETQATLENVQKIVTAAGFSMRDVVAVNVYLADVQEFAAMNTVYKTFFPDPKPTRTTVQAAALIGGARIEISAIAVKPGR